MMQVSKRYPNGTVALKNIDLLVKPGEFVFIVGESGAGKSSLIKTMYAEEKVTTGQVFVNGKNINRMRQKDIAQLRRKIGVVFQDFHLLNDRSVFENVAFALKVMEQTPKEIERRVPQVLEWVGLSHKADFPPTELSGGEKQRIVLARAIVNNPVLLIADEPTGNLDPDTSRIIVRLIEDVNRRGTTVLMTTHERTIVDEMSKRVIRVAGGEIVSDVEGGTYHAL